MIENDFDHKTYANMSIVLEDVCRLLPKECDNYASRRLVAERMLQYARNNAGTLTALRAVGRQAVAELRVVEKQVV